MDNRLRYNESTDRFWAPHRGKFPECPKGYINHPADPYQCISDLQVCEYREVKEWIRKSCGCPETKTTCNMVNRTITLAVCMRCEKMGKDFIKDRLGS